ncbi:MAG: acyl carrier protein [Lachnospiraceae bacterium]|nr:acyl carrier protein [Lachnospiraceae bacterium]
MLEKIKAIIVEGTGADETKITAEASFKEDLGLDSLDLFELVMKFEDEFGVEIPTDDLEQITTVGALMEYIEKLQ